MRVLLLSWEYPPQVVGGLGRHVAALSRTLVQLGHEVHVVTRGRADLPSAETLDGVQVHRVTTPAPHVPFADLVPWVLAFNTEVLATGTRLCRDHAFDVVHAHDWLVAYAAAGLRRAFDLPLAATIHATEIGRHQGWLPGPMNKLIHQVEWWLTDEADRVITCSRYMRRHVTDVFDLDGDEVDVIHNGVERRDFALPADEVAAFRASTTPNGERLVVFAGRLEYEKGVQTVLEALDQVRSTVGPTIFKVCGVGTYSEALRARVDELGLDDVHFTGFLADHELRLHYAAADVAVAPSIYEPFGLVAVEAMACGTPVVVGDTGGLREIVSHGAGGLRFPPEDAAQLAERIVTLMTDDALAADLAAAGERRIRRRHAWRTVARRTAAAYDRTVALRREGPADGADTDPRRLRSQLHAAAILELRPLERDRDADTGRGDTGRDDTGRADSNPGDTSLGESA